MNYILIMLISIVLTVLAVGTLIPVLHRLKFGQPIREEGNKAHYKKAGTPTMGGLAFTLVFILMSLVTIKFNLNLAFILITTLLFGIIGFIDDYEKIAKKNNLGLTSKQKLILQFAVSFMLSIFAYFVLNIDMGKLYIPLIKNPISIGILTIPIYTVIMVGTTNAVNLTDGLDGLLSSVSIPVFLGISVISMNFFNEVGISALIFAATLLGFLVYNSNPASVFMGDTGSMAIGGAIVSMLIVLNKPIYLLILGGVYVMEAMSVIIQVIYFKKTGGKRIFKMSPIHHHFELSGHKETKIVASFMALSTILVLITILLI